MADLYAELITNINKTIDPLENGEIAVAKAKQAASADTADKAGNCEIANIAETVGKANIASFSNVVPDMGFPLYTSCQVSSGKTNDCSLEDGVYLVVYDCKFNTSYQRYLCGVMVVKGSNGSDCRICEVDNNFHGMVIQYRPNNTYQIEVCYWGDYGITRCSSANGTIYFYKIGTLQEE